MHSFLQSIRIGFFLAYRSIKRASLWSTGLIVAVMILTFLNIVVVSGVLVGLIEGSVNAQKGRYLGDFFVEPLTEKEYIENSQYLIGILNSLPEVDMMSSRYIGSATVESNYQYKVDPTDTAEEAGTVLVGINPKQELEITDLDEYLVEGSFIQDNDFDQVVVGALLLKKYFNLDAEGFPVIDAELGDTILIRADNVEREVIIKGIIKTKVDQNDRRIFFPEKQLRQMIGRDDFNVGEIAVRLNEEVDANDFKKKLQALGFERYAKIKTAEEAFPKFLEDIKNTFALLGNMISSIGLVVASITIFIVIFINALTRKKFIGILKGIGIDRRAIEFSYMFQSIFYAVIGSSIGLLVLYGFLVPFIDANPIDFPFSDGILVASALSTSVRLIILIIITLIAGYIPARMIVRKNTLDSILGR